MHEHIVVVMDRHSKLKVVKSDRVPKARTNYNISCKTWELVGYEEEKTDRR